jgi:GNAT superfamily N-acetyltransferase
MQERLPVGAFALLIMDNFGHQGASSGVVEDVVVRKDARGQGIGKKMMEFAMRKCRERGCYKVTLSSNLNRIDAHKFYEKLGYQRHGYSFFTNLHKEDVQL